MLVTLSAAANNETRCLSGVCIGQPLDQVAVQWADEESVPEELRALMKLYLDARVPNGDRARAALSDARARGDASRRPGVVGKGR
jgi:hypothetical protein